jgi:hypothetical protein
VAALVAADAAMCPRVVVAALLVIAAIAGTSPAVAGAAGGQAKPSAEQLWNQYPLRQATPSATPQPSRTVTAGAPAAADDLSPSGGGSLALVLVLLVVAGLVVVGALVVRRRPAPPPEPTPMTPATRRRPPASPPLRAVERPAVAPPLPAVRWDAEIAWDAGGGMGRFRAFATPSEGGSRSEVGQSRLLRWPPSGPSDIADLTRAAAELEGALLDAGWSSAEHGDEWYAQRFTWIPAPSPAREPRVPVQHAAAPAPKPRPRSQPPDPPVPDAVPAAGRFWRAEPWPADTEGLWRCEIRWSAGWVKSRFEAVAVAPGERRGTPISVTDPIKWMMKADPEPDSPEGRAALAQLIRELLAAGWEREGRGRHWYAQRFSWRRDGDPQPSASAARKARA